MVIGFWASAFLLVNFGLAVALVNFHAFGQRRRLQVLASLARAVFFRETLRNIWCGFLGVFYGAGIFPFGFYRRFIGSPGARVVFWPGFLFLARPAQSKGPILVGGAVARPAASTEPDMKVSLHPAPEHTGCCHQHHDE